MRIAIIGAGALGLMFGAYLAQNKNNEVIFLNINDKEINDINEKGCICYDGDSKITSKVKAFKNGSVNSPYDLVMLLTKTYNSKESIEANLGLFNKDTYLLTLQNGLGHRDKLKEYVDENHLIIGVTKNNAIKLDSISTRRANHNITTLGYNCHNKSFVEKLVKMFESASFSCKISSEIETLVWNKAFLNIATNAYCAYYNLTIDELVKNDEVWSYSKEAAREAINVANALGQKFIPFIEIDNIYKEIYGLNGRPSMWQDVNAKRPTEIMSLNGKIVELGKKLGIDVSENERITKLIIELENSYKH